MTRAAALVEDVDHLLGDGDIGDEDVVREHQQERLVADDVAACSTAWPMPFCSFCRT